MHSGRATYVQSEFTYSTGLNSNIPKFLSIGGDDFFNFVIPLNFPPYRVLVTSLIDDGYGNFDKKLGNLAPRVSIPNAQLDPKGSVTLIPYDPSYPTYIGDMRRGRTYTIPPLRNFGKDTTGRGGCRVVPLTHC